MTTKKKDGDLSLDPSERPPEYLVERLAAGDLPFARAADVRRRLAADLTGALRLEAIAASNEATLAAHPPAVVVAEVRRRAAAGGGRLPGVAKPTRYGLPRWGLALGVPGALAAALALVLWLRPSANDVTAPDGQPRVQGQGDTERSKGLRPTLRVYRKNAGKIERLRDGAPAHAGDELQVAYVAAGHKYGVVLSVDGAGHVTYHLPAAAGPAARLRADGEVALPEAYQLDAAPGFERFVLVVGDRPFDAAMLAAAIEGKGASPAGTTAAWFTVRKE